MANIIDRKSLKAATGGQYAASRNTTRSGGPNMPGDSGGATLATKSASPTPPRRRP